MTETWLEEIIEIIKNKKKETKIERKKRKVKMEKRKRKKQKVEEKGKHDGKREERSPSLVYKTGRFSYFQNFVRQIPLRDS